MKKLLNMMFSLLFLLTACSSPAIQNTPKVNVTDNHAVKHTLNELINADEEIIGGSDYSDVKIIPINDDLDNTNYFILTGKDDWLKNLWHITYDGQAITKKALVEDMGGYIIRCEMLTISQGTFLEVYVSSHMGNGDTVLLNIDTLQVQYCFKGTVDSYNENFVSDTILEKFNLPYEQGKDGGCGYSFMYIGGFLTSTYLDIDGDNNADAIFYGTKELVSDTDSFPDLDGTPINCEYIKEVYLYDSKEKTFVFNKDRSTTDQVPQ